MKLLPEPDCPSGYPEYQLREMLDDDGLANFKKWMVGQTVTLCDGQLYDHDTALYYASPCAANPHGVVYYKHDLERFLKHQPIID